MTEILSLAAEFKELPFMVMFCILVALVFKHLREKDTAHNSALFRLSESLDNNTKVLQEVIHGIGRSK